MLTVRLNKTSFANDFSKRSDVSMQSVRRRHCGDALRDAQRDGDDLVRIDSLGSANAACRCSHRRRRSSHAWARSSFETYFIDRYLCLLSLSLIHTQKLFLLAKAAKKLLVASRPTIDSFQSSTVSHRIVIIGGIEVFLFDTQPNNADKTLPVFGIKLFLLFLFFIRIDN